MKTTDTIETKTTSKAIANKVAEHQNRYPVVETIHSKLNIGQPGDKYEQEADRTADTIMSMPDPIVQHQEEEEEYVQTKPFLQTQTLEEEEQLQAKWIQREVGMEEEQEIQDEIIQKQAEEEEEPVQTKSNDQSSIDHAPSWIQSKINSSNGSGGRLPDTTRSFMENRFRSDFSNVRIHNNANAAQLNRELNAQAFTVGRDIYFNSGKYNPESSSGKHLLAHELTHVVQQQPQLSKYPEDESETTSTFKELETATKDVKKYMDYIKECAERSKKYGVPLPENIKKAAERIMEISQSISSKLNLVETAIETVQQGLDWAKGIYSVANNIASLDLRPGNKASLEAFLESLDMLNNASKPAQTWAESLARKGAVAARFSFVFSVVVAEFEIGLKALKMGIKHARAHEAKTHRRILTEDKSTERRIKAPTPPAFPLTEAEEKALSKARREMDRIQSERNVENMFREHFKVSVFPLRDNYPKYRPNLLILVREALLARLKKPQMLSEETVSKKLKEEEWWKCLTYSGEDSYDHGEGIYLWPRKTTINDNESFWEIQCFKEVGPPCPFFNALYDLAYEEFRRREYKNFARKIFSR